VSGAGDDGLHGAAEDEPTFAPAGGSLPPAEAAFFEYELGKHGIEARLCAAEEPGPELVIEVRATDLEAAAAVRREVFRTSGDPAADRASTLRAGWRRKALLAAATGAVAVLYLGRVQSGAFRGVLAIVVGAVFYIAVSARLKAGRARHDDGRPTSDADDA
jgi:hypothetical protein